MAEFVQVAVLNATFAAVLGALFLAGATTES